ncbi:hypothetical protein [Parafilimonas terrae]|jgi:hypothetical protein|uniref:Uncharacterized protein n=1 Tax=Parafilimonas terrae TaxID=1465490 RepID=A0A1I5ZAA1_9BACT|nr:hypothetical protein [Parafilimonas terrae]SFQ53047.1 hypothetical protein SAMN05444277_1182 [Parafilimonas terrae]
MKLTALIFSVFVFFTSSFGQDNSDLKLADFHFFSMFGVNTKDTNRHVTYCLLGSGFFRTPHTDNSDSVISDWINKHPNATVIPVSSDGPVMQNNPDSRQIYCWVVDNQDTLNNSLVKNGCFPGSTMLRPQAWNEMSEEMKKFYTNNKIDHGTTEILIDKKSYDMFLEQIKADEKYAYDNRLGIWGDENLRKH